MSYLGVYRHNSPSGSTSHLRRIRVLPPLSGGNLTLETNRLQVLVRMRIQSYIEMDELSLRCNVEKSSCMSLVYGFMRLVHREDNPNKKTLKDKPYVSARADTTWIASRQINHSRTLIIPEVLIVGKLYLQHHVLRWTIGHMTIRDRYVEAIIQTRKPHKYTWLVHSHSPAIQAKIGLRWEKSQQQVGCVCHRLGAPIRSTIQYLQRGSKPNSRVVLSCRGYLINVVISRVRAHSFIEIWKGSGRGKLSGVHSSIGSDEESP